MKRFKCDNTFGIAVSDSWEDDKRHMTSEIREVFLASREIDGAQDFAIGWTNLITEHYVQRRKVHLMMERKVEVARIIAEETGKRTRSTLKLKFRDGLRRISSRIMLFLFP